MASERDAELVAGLAADLPTGFEALVRAYQDRLYAFALAMSGEPADAEEIALDGLLRAYNALGRYPPDRVRALRLSSWLHQIVLNVFRNRVRRRALRLVPLDAETVVPDPSAGPEAQSLSRAAQRELANLISGLPDNQRSAVVLRCVQGMTYAEAAVALSQPEGTVKSNVHRGLQALRRRAGWLSEVS